MKKKIGFIDLFIDEWHANNYPKWIRESALKDEFEVAMAWEKYTPEGKKSLQEWCGEQGVAPASSIEEVVDKCDCICILAPSNPEVHEELAEYALKSGKPVYIDKPFTLGRAAAQRLFDLARKHKTPLMSSSALRFSNELMEEHKKQNTTLFVNTCGGGGNFPEYAIHQIEMIVSLLGIGASALQVCGNEENLTVAIRYPDQRLAAMNYSPYWGFRLNAANESEVFQLDSMSNIFPNLLLKILEFFNSRESIIPVDETIEIAAVLDAVIKGMKKPAQWIQID